MSLAPDQINAMLNLFKDPEENSDSDIDEVRLV